MVAMKWCTIVVLVLVGNTWADNSVDSVNYSLFNCPELKSQESLDLEGAVNETISHHELINLKNIIGNNLDLAIRNIRDEYDSVIKRFENIIRGFQKKEEDIFFNNTKDDYLSELERLMTNLDPDLRKAKDANASICHVILDKRLPAIDEYVRDSIHACYHQYRTREVQPIIDIKMGKRKLLKKFKRLQKKLNQCRIGDDATSDKSHKCINAIMGKWYVVEVLDHKMEQTRQMSTARVIIDSCPVLKLKSDDRGLLRLLWQEEAGDLEYTFRVPDSVRAPGFWLSTAQQNGTLTLKSYSQFAGTVHVMKAVANHVVLTFCAGHPDNQLYSVLMSREHILQKSNIKGVHNLLGRRHLRIVSVRETCAKGKASRITGSLIGLCICWLVFLRRSIALWQ